MIDHPQIKLILKRYPKGSNYFDASIDLRDIPVSEILHALHRAKEDRDVRPRLLDAHAIREFSLHWPNAFDPDAFDYFIHIYRSREIEPVSSSIGDSLLGAPSEDGPPSAIPLSDGTRWLSVRPGEDGFESYEAVDIDTPE